MKHMPSSSRAERNQRRKLAFIPVWPVAAAIVLVVLLVLFAR
jgi:type VI protein secretion system component VasF